MNIHLPAILGEQKGTRVLTHPHILGIVDPTDFHAMIFQRGRRKTTNQTGLVTSFVRSILQLPSFWGNSIPPMTWEQQRLSS